MLRLFRFAVYLLVALAGLVFAVLNAQPVLFNYYFGSRDIPLAFIVAEAIAFGALLGVSASLGMVVKAKRQTSGLRRLVVVVVCVFVFLCLFSLFVFFCCVFVVCLC